MDKTKSAQKMSVGPDNPIKNSDAAPKSNKENNDFLPVSVAFKPRKPSGSRLASEIQRYEEDKQIEVERARPEELKKYAHLAMASVPTSTRGAKVDTYNDVVSQRISEIASHRKEMVAQEQALAKAEDRMRKGKNRANEVPPDLEIGVGRVPIKFGGSNKRDYSYIKEPIAAEPAAEVIALVKSAPRPASGGRTRRTSAPGTRTGTLPRPSSANIILDSKSKKTGAEQATDLELQGVIMSRDQSQLSEDERNIAEFLRVKVMKVEDSPKSNSAKGKSKDTISADYTATFTGMDYAGERGPLLDGGGMPLSLSRGIAFPVSTTSPKHEIVSISIANANAHANANAQKTDLKTLETAVLLALQPIATCPTKSAADVTATDDIPVRDDVHGAEIREGTTPPAPAAAVRNPVPHAQIASASSRDENTAYSPDSSIESTQDILGDVCPGHEGGVFSQPSVVVGENAEAPAQSESTRIRLTLKKHIQPGKKGGSASIVSKYAGKNVSGLIINSTSINAKALINMNAALSVVKEENSVADSRSNPLFLQHLPSEQGSPTNNAQYPLTASADAEVVSAGAATHLREKYNQAISLDQQVNESGGSAAASNREEDFARAKMLRVQAAAAQQPLRVTGAQNRPHSADGALPSSSSHDAAPSGPQVRMLKTANNHNIIAKNLQAAGAYKIFAGSANARLTSSFRSEIGEPTKKENAIKELKEQGRTSHTPLERAIRAGLASPGEEAVLPMLAIDDSCLLSPAPMTLSASKAKSSPQPQPQLHFIHNPTPEVLLQRISRKVKYVESANAVVRYLPADNISDARGAEFQLFTDTHNTVLNVKEVYEQRRKSPVGSPNRPGSPVLTMPDTLPEAQDYERGAGTTDSMLGDSLNVSQVHSLHETKSFNMSVEEAGFELAAPDPSGMEMAMETPSTQTQPEERKGAEAGEEEAQEVKVPENLVRKSRSKHNDVSNTSLMHSFPSARLDGFRDSANMSTVLLGDSLTGSVLGILSTDKSGINAKTPMLSLSPFLITPAMNSIGAFELHTFETVENKTHMHTKNTEQRKEGGGNRAISTVTKATPASKAKMKVRGVESSAAEFTTLEEKRNIAKYSWLQLQKRLRLGQERLHHSVAVKLNETMAIEELVLEPAEHILDSEMMQSFDTLQKQCDKFAHIANEDITQEDVNFILSMHEKAKRAEARYEQRLHHIERKHLRRVREVAEKSGLRGEDLVYPGFHIPISESKEEKQEDTIQVENMNINVDDAPGSNALMLAKKKSTRSHISRKGKTFDALNKGVFIGDHHMDNMDHDVSQRTQGEDYHALPALGAVSAAADGCYTKLDQDKSNAVITESLELSSNFAIGMTESTFVAAKSFEVLDSMNLHEAALKDASGAIAIGASALETSLDFGMGMNNPHVLDKVDSGPRSERSKFHLTFLFNDSQITDGVQLNEGSSVFKDSIYSYSRNQTQTIHAPAAHGSMLRSGVGIQHNKPGYAASSKSGNVGLRDIEPTVRPRSATVTSSRHQQPAFFENRDLGNMLNQSFSFDKLKISGKGSSNSATVPAVSALGHQVAPEAAFADSYSINNMISYKSNIPSIRDTRMQEREKRFYKQEQLKRNEGQEAPAPGRGGARPSTAGAARTSKAPSAPKAAEVGLRMVNWKYGSFVSVEDGSHQAHKKAAGGKIASDKNVKTDDEFVASALLQGRAEYLAGNNTVSDMWLNQSFQASQNELFDTLLNHSKDISGDNYGTMPPLAPSASTSAAANEAKRVELIQEQTTSNRSSINISESTKRAIRVIPSPYFNIDSNKPAPQSRHLYPSDYMEKELKILQVTGGQPKLNSSRRNY